MIQLATTRPMLENVIETFFPLEIMSRFNTRGDYWAYYAQTLRKRITPLMAQFQHEALIKWFSFLIHGKDEVGPDYDGASELFIHLRIEVAQEVSADSLIERLPPDFVGTRRMDMSNDGAMTGLSATSLRDGEIAEAWKVLGESSVWILNALEAHQPDTDIPPSQMLQFVHFIENGLAIRVLGYRVGPFKIYGP